MKKMSVKTTAIVMAFNMLIIFAAFAILKIDYQDFWTQAWMIIGAALLGGMTALIAAQLFGIKEQKR